MAYPFISHLLLTSPRVLAYIVYYHFSSAWEVLLENDDVDYPRVSWRHILLLSVVSSCRSHIGKAWTEIIPTADDDLGHGIEMRYEMTIYELDHLRVDVSRSDANRMISLHASLKTKRASLG